MIFVVLTTLTVAILAGFVTLILAIKHAPSGHEDKFGFHSAEVPQVSSVEDNLDPLNSTGSA
jgi:hypothetical protein